LKILQIGFSKMSKTDNIYWDGAYVNSNVDPQPIVINESRTQALIDKPQEYKVAVDTFSFISSGWPIFTAKPRLTGASSVTELKYYVQFLYAGTTSSQFLLMKTVNSWNAPTAVSATNNLTNQPYYGIYSHAQFLEMLNIAFASCYTTLLGNGFPGAVGTIPFVTMNADTGRLALTVPQTFVTNSVDIVLSSDMNYKLNLPYDHIIRDNALVPTPNISHRITSTMFTRYSYVQSSTFFMSQTLIAGQIANTAYWAGAAYVLVNDHDYRADWYDIHKIIVESNLAAAESISTATPGASIQSLNRNILASYDLDLVGDNHINGQILYSPPFRKWLNLLPSTPITQINIEFKFTDRAGNFYPILQNYGQLAQIRLLFEKVTRERDEVEEVQSKRVKY
jgi:hypothetical protein